MSYQYKPIALPWLIRIPEHWDLVRNKVLLHETKTTVGSEHAKYQLLSLTKGGVIIRDISSGKGKFPNDFGTYKTVSDGQIIFCLFDIDETPRTVGLSKYNGMITGAYDVFSINGVNSRFLEYYYISLDNVKAMRPLYTGLRKVIGINTFLQTHFPLPPRDEQDQIVRYLDWKVSQINKLISAKRRQIALLQEQKRAVIENTLKNSDSPIMLCRYLGTFQNGINESGVFFTAGTPFVNYSDVYKNEILPHIINGKAKSNPKQQETYSVENGDIFFTRTSETIDEVGLTSVCNETIPQAVFSGFLIRFRPKIGIFDNMYAKYFFRSKRVRDYFTQEMNLVTRVSLGQTLIKNLPILLPDLEVQREVSRQLDERCTIIEKLKGKLNDEIALLTEYRTRLISDIVTGKVDVRGVAIGNIAEEVELENADEDDSEIDLMESEE